VGKSLKLQHDIAAPAGIDEHRISFELAVQWPPPPPPPHPPPFRIGIWQQLANK